MQRDSWNKWKRNEKEFYLKLLLTASEERKNDYFIISTGEGGTGKFTLHECLGNALGTYAQSIETQYFKETEKDGLTIEC